MTSPRFGEEGEAARVASPITPIIQKDEALLVPEKLEEVIILGHGLTLNAHWLSQHSNFGFMQKRKEGKLQIWGMNKIPFVFHCDLCFNMHDLERLRVFEPQNDYLAAYREFMPPDIPLVSVKCYDDLPCPSVRYPIEQVIEELQEPYFANGVTYAIAWAIMCGVKRTWLWGCDYDYPDRPDYEAGKANVEYWLGYAKGKLGTIATVSSESALKDTCWRSGGAAKGRIGYGATYGYFDQGPIIQRDAKTGLYSVTEFRSMDQDVENAFQNPESLNQEEA